MLERQVSEDNNEDNQNDKVIDIIKAYKKIYKTENILSAVLLVLENIRTHFGEKAKEMNDLLSNAESLVYKTINNYYNDGPSVRDNLANMIFYINVLKLKNLVSDNNYASLIEAYNTLISAYETVYEKDKFSRDGEIKDIDLKMTSDSPEIYDDFEYQVKDNSEDSDAGESIEALLEMPERKERQGSNVKDMDKKTKTLSTSNGQQLDISPRQITRREEILRTLSDVTPITIKDISNKVLGCSEKTIQRELNSMLEDGVIERIGEKRWSKYLLK